MYRHSDTGSFLNSAPIYQASPFTFIPRGSNRMFAFRLLSNQRALSHLTKSNGFAPVQLSVSIIFTFAMLFFVAVLPWRAAIAEPALQEAGKPRLIAFRAEWCAPCRRLTPALNKVKKSFGSKIDVIEVDVDDVNNRTLVDQYQVNVVPTAVFISEAGTTQIIPGVNAQNLSAGARALARSAPRQIGAR